MEATIGRIVIFKLSADYATQINRRRTTGASIAARIKNDSAEWKNHWPEGAQAHIGNEAHEGDDFPMMVTKVWSPGCVNGQVFLDGNDCLWVTSAMEGNGVGQWLWPVMKVVAEPLVAGIKPVPFEPAEVVPAVEVPAEMPKGA